MSKSVFISHATKDINLVKALVGLIESGIGVPDDEIFCSSLDGYGIPVGKNFVDYMRQQITEPKVVIMLLTPSYFDSNFCLCEMGAAWVKSHKVIPIIVPPSSFSDIKDVLLGVQAIKIDDKLKLNDLKDELTNSIQCAKKNSSKWDVSRDVFLNGLQDILEKLNKPDSVSRKEYDKVKENYNEALKIVSDNAQEIQTLNDYVNKLKSLKNKEEVRVLADDYEPGDNVSEFYELLKQIKEVGQKFPSKTVFRYIICQYYSKPFGDVDSANKECFDEAIRRNYLACDNGIEVNESNNNVRLLHDLLNKLNFYRSNETVIQEFNDCQTVPFELDNEEFWDAFYMN